MNKHAELNAKLQADPTLAPRLVEALRQVVKGPKPGAWPNVAVNDARALLRELGE